MLSLLTTAMDVETRADVPKSKLSTCVLIYAHAKTQALGKPPDCSSFGDYANVFVASVFKHFRQTATRVDVTFDRYLGQQSIKSSTRTKRSAKRRPVWKLIQGPEVPLPQAWAQFIALEDNKETLQNTCRKNCYKKLQLWQVIVKLLPEEPFLIL